MADDTEPRDEQSAVDADQRNDDPPVNEKFAEPRVAPAGKRRTKPDLRAVVRVVAKFTAGTVAAWVAIAGVGAAAMFDAPPRTMAAPSFTVTPIPAAQQLLCPGAFLRLAGDSGEDASSPSPIGRPSTRYASTAGDTSLEPITESEAGTGGTADAPLVLTAAPDAETESNLLAGAQSQSVDLDEARGFEASTCAQASVVTWLVGGATDLGRTTLISLVNPTEVDASVDLEIFSESGLVTAPGLTGIIVAPHSQRLLPLAGFAPGILSPAVRVTSSGGQVVAGLQQTTVRTIEPGGVDAVGATTSPAKTTTIPGVRIVRVEAMQAKLGLEGYGDLTTVLRILVPGDEPTGARISLIPDSGSRDGLSFELELGAAAVTDIPLDEVANGTYTVQIESDVAVTAGVRVSEVGTLASDFVWLAAARDLVGEALVAVAPGPSPLLHLFNAGLEPTSIVLSKIDGGESSYTVAAGTGLAIPVSPGASYRLSGFDRLLASVTFAGDGALGAYAVRPASAAPSPIVVHVR